jgi:hypothetical protein
MGGEQAGSIHRVSGLFALHSFTLFGYFLFFEYTDQYFRLGIASCVLEMVPFASILFSFTNTVGAALWAADLEKATK